MKTTNAKTVKNPEVSEEQEPHNLPGSSRCERFAFGRQRVQLGGEGRLFVHDGLSDDDTEYLSVQGQEQRRGVSQTRLPDLFMCRKFPISNEQEMGRITTSGGQGDAGHEIDQIVLLEVDGSEDRAEGPWNDQPEQFGNVTGRKADHENCPGGVKTREGIEGGLSTRVHNADVIGKTGDGKGTGVAAPLTKLRCDVVANKRFVGPLGRHKDITEVRKEAGHQDAEHVATKNQTRPCATEKNSQAPINHKYDRVTKSEIVGGEAIMRGAENRYGKIDVGFGSKQSEVDFRKRRIVGDPMQAWPDRVDAFVNNIHERERQKVSENSQGSSSYVVRPSDNGPSREND